MKLPRVTLLKALETIAPALSTSNLIPILNHIWFTGTSLLCFNDQIALSVPLKTDFKGAVPSTLLTLLKNSGAKEVEFVPGEDHELEIKAAKARLRLSTMTPEGFIFKIPESKKRSMLSNSGDFAKALGACLRSIGADASVPEQMGITLIPNSKQLHLYATNDVTLSHVRVQVKDQPKKRCILPTEFCRQFVALVKGANPVSLEISDDYALAKLGDVTLFGRLVASDHPLDFDTILKDGFPDFGKSDKLPKTPAGIRFALERATIITSSRLEPTKTKFVVQGESMEMISASDRGTVNDRLMADKNQKAVKIRLDPNWLKAGLTYDEDERFLLTNRCAIIYDTAIDAVFMVAGAEE